MKSFVTCILVFAALQQQLTDLSSLSVSKNKISPSGNIVIITLDGFRWQEIFTGADSVLINNEKYTPDAATMKMLYWSPDTEGRRKKLLPFFWNVIATKGQLYGNRNYDNKVNTSNIYSISYPGYNEMLTGNTDITVFSNRKNLNPNINVLEYLNTKEQFRGKVAAFTSWDVFPYILNKERSGITLNSGYENMNEDDNNAEQQLINKVQGEAVHDKKATRHDELTFLTAREYIQQHQPKVIYLGLGETDEAAHDARYDLYLEKAADADRMIAQLWHIVQTTPGYKDNTTFIITTDHGRGKKTRSWSEHGAFINGSSQTWLAVMGPAITPIGEVKEDQQIYQKQVAQTIAALLGEKFESDQPVAAAISLTYGF
jgi:hypothetical protein